MRKILMGAGAGLALLTGVIGYNTWQFTPQASQSAAPYVLGADIDAAAQSLSKAVQFKTIANGSHQEEFDGFLALLKSEFPLIANKLTLEPLANNTQLYTWHGTDPSLAPVLLAAHSDVVPISFGSLDRWSYTPFSGEIADGYVWGRGTLDDKGALIAIMATVEHLLATGFTPKRTVYLSFGGDEEIGGDGALAVANHLIAQGVTLDWALDEGSFVLQDVIPGLDVPVASINLAEKGYVTVKLVARSPGGHSALPPRVTAVGRIARAVDALQTTPVPGGLSDVSGAFFDNLGRHFSLEKRVLFANTWLFSPLLNVVLSDAATTNAMLRTTTAPTMLAGSNKENVLAAEASAVINFRIHPRDTIDSVIAHVTETIDDPEVEIVVDRQFSSNPSPVADEASAGYTQIQTAITQAFGPLATVPGLTIAATDARHYALAAKNAFRINPFKVTNDDIARFHGIDERLSIENLEAGMNFYGALLSKQ
ncbi:M20 family peptidase [uncultured Pelagimonas sp.]|uniref:M20 family peptidase n=1 Tax=uncultured Pelagimonas sp. TaxID=1618102 RepID=UPI002620B82E|nr:M20 family peptidase [uncultured Pelagimonas sp.]